MGLPESAIKGRVTIPNLDDVRSDVSDVRSDVRPELSVLGWRRIGHVPGRVITDCRGRRAARLGFYSNPRAVRIK